MNYFSKTYIFFYAVLLIGIFVLYKSTSFEYHGVIDVTIAQQKGAIRTLDTPKNIGQKRHISIDRLNFPSAKTLTHKRFGMLGFSNNFFINAKVAMQVHQKGLYTFVVASDDGFRLTMDNTLICEHVKDRPYQKSTCKVNISKGKHRFELNYFQGGGPLGLHVTYALEGKTFYDVGEDTSMITFKEMKHD